MNFTGTWRARMEASRFLGTPPQSVVVEIEHDEPRLVQSMCVTTATGEERLKFAWTTDGQESVNLIRGVEGRTRARWAGEELVIETSMTTPAREFRFRDCWSIEPDGMLVMEHRDDDLAGQRVVFDRV